MDMKKIDGVWHICRDGWVYVVAKKSEVINHVFNGMSLQRFESCFKATKEIVSNERVNV